MNDTTLYRFFMYDGTRILQMIIGITGNGLTLRIIWNLKVLTNGYILMTYMAVSHILVNCVVPFAAISDFIGSLENRSRYNWKTLSFCKDTIYIIALIFSFIYYFIISVDR